MARPYWSGQIQISLVSFGVKLFPATEAKSEIRFHQINRKSGDRVRHQKVSSDNDAPVEKENIVKGYEYSKGEYIQIEPDEVANLRLPSKHTL
jgi:DNA end-binding protein Ku